MASWAWRCLLWPLYMRFPTDRLFWLRPRAVYRPFVSAGMPVSGALCALYHVEYPSTCALRVVSPCFLECARPPQSDSPRPAAVLRRRCRSNNTGSKISRISIDGSQASFTCSDTAPVTPVDLARQQCCQCTSLQAARHLESASRYLQQSKVRYRRGLQSRSEAGALDHVFCITAHACSV